MIPRAPKRPAYLRRFLGGLVIFEALLCGGSYLVYRQLNNSREFREKAKTSAPWVLEFYYKMGETINRNSKAIRETDEQIWMKKSD